ncbi:MAG: AI-2E family transporter [Aestuariivirga sp.]
MWQRTVTERDIRQIRICLIGLFILAFTFMLDFARGFLLPVVLAFLIALTFRPAIRSLARHHVPLWLAAIGFMALVIVAGFSLAYLMIQPIEQWIADAPEYARKFTDKAREFRYFTDAIASLAAWLEDAASTAGPQAAQEVVVKEPQFFNLAGEVTGYSAGILATLVLTLVIAGFLMASGDLFYAKLVRVLPTMHDKKTALRIVYDVEREVSSYLLIVAAINAGLGLAVAGSFYLLGMPTPFLWGILAFFLNFIPYVGSIFGVSLAAFMAVVTFDSLGFALAVPLAYAFWNGVENQFATPMLLGRRLQLNAVAILLALAFWTWLWGVAGTMVAVPILVTIKVFCDHLDGLSAIGEFLSEKYPDENGNVASAPEAIQGAGKSPAGAAAREKP